MTYENCIGAELRPALLWPMVIPVNNSAKILDWTSRVLGRVGATLYIPAIAPGHNTKRVYPTILVFAAKLDLFGRDRSNEWSLVLLRAVRKMTKGET